MDSETGSRYFNGKAGFFSVLHTNDQRLNHHPHVHVVIPAGALSKDRTSWNSCHPAFFLPVRKLSAAFRDKLIFYLRKEEKAGILVIPKTIDNVNVLLDKLQNIPWVAHSQAPGKGKNNPQHMIRYLSRYVAGAAVNERRIIQCKKGNVYLSYIDRKRHKAKTEIISGQLFLKRPAFHILPKGFKKVRFYGFMAGCRIFCGRTAGTR